MRSNGSSCTWNRGTRRHGGQRNPPATRARVFYGRGKESATSAKTCTSTASSPIDRDRVARRRVLPALGLRGLGRLGGVSTRGRGRRPGVAQGGDGRLESRLGRLALGLDLRQQGLLGLQEPVAVADVRAVG